LLCSRWRHHRDDTASRNAASPDAVDHFLSSAVRGTAIRSGQCK
jgi:hypothetical protein